MGCRDVFQKARAGSARRGGGRAGRAACPCGKRVPHDPGRDRGGSSRAEPAASRKTPVSGGTLTMVPTLQQAAGTAEQPRPAPPFGTPGTPSHLQKTGRAPLPQGKRRAPV